MSAHWQPPSVEMKLASPVVCVLDYISILGSILYWSGVVGGIDVEKSGLKVGRKTRTRY